MTRTPSLANLIRDAMTARVRELHTAMVGKVVVYYPSTQTVDVQPLVKRVFLDPDGIEVSERYPQVLSVPLAFPQAGGFFVSFPVVPGDVVLLVFCERAIDQWWVKDRETDPGDLRMHSTADAIAIPGVVAKPSALEDVHAENLVLGKDGGAQIHIKPSGEVHIAEENAADYVALATATKAEITALRNTVNTLVTAHNTHVHLGVDAVTGAALTISPPAIQGTAPAAVGDVKATKVKAT